jgi:hypothetical protein
MSKDKDNPKGQKVTQKGSDEDCGLPQGPEKGEKDQLKKAA